MSITTVHDPIFSRLQSALHHAIAKRATTAGLDPTDAAAPSAELSSGHPAMQAVATLGNAQVEGGPVQQGVAPSGSVDVECARLSWQYVQARWDGNQPLAQQIDDELKFSSCDPLWSEVIVAYEEFVHSGNAIPYIALQPGAGVIPVPGALKVALLADWGTGTGTAQNVLTQAMAMEPDMIVHLGDVYYSGTPTEQQQYFYQPMQAAIQKAGKTMGTAPGDVRVFTTPGNHDMYSGGAGFYSVIKQIGQPASYFCLQSDDWQVICLDTGYNDRDPSTVSSNITSLTPDQVVWLNALMANAGSRRTILLSHHQLFSGASDVGQSKVGSKTVNWGINPLLYSQLQAILDRVTVWIWGHEHNTVVFKPQPGLPLGRCIGSAAIPEMVIQDPYTTDTTLQGVAGIPVPTMDLTYTLGNNGTEFNHGFAMLSLTGASATVTYYQVPYLAAAEQLGPAETFPKL